jgi:hypothetical protein
MWLAGIIEGEGTIGVAKGKYPVVAVVMSDGDVVRRCQEYAGHGSVRGPYDRPNGNLPLWGWKITGRHAAGLMMTIYPLMGIRRQAKIQECLTTWKTVRRWGTVWCSVDGCSNTHCAKGFCSMHYQREYK